MSTIYIGERQSGKTTMLIEMSEKKTGATIVVATYPMANYIQLLAAQMGKKNSCSHHSDELYPSSRKRRPW